MAMVTALLMGATGCSNQGTVDDAQIYGEGVDSSFETDDMQLETCIFVWVRLSQWIFSAGNGSAIWTS